MFSSKKTTIEEYTKQVSRTTSFLKKYGLAILFMTPYLISFLVFFMYPFIKGCIMSLYRYNIANPSDIAWRGFLNYYKILFDSNTSYYRDFWNGMKNTLIAAAIIVPLCILIPLGLALLINGKPPGYKIYRAIIYLPGIFPITATGVIFLNIFNNEYGFINNLLKINVNWLQNPTTVWIIIILFCVWGGLGTNFVIFTAALQNVDKSLYEASAIDGCSKFRQKFDVTFPQIKNQMIICLFTTVCGYMNLYGQCYILGSYVQPQNSVYTVIYVIQNQLKGTNFAVYGMTSAMAICLGVFIAIISIIQMVITKERKGGNKYAKQFKAFKESGKIS